MSERFDEEEQHEISTGSRGGMRALMIVAGVLIFGFLALSAVSAVWTEQLWFSAVGYEEVFGTLVWTRIGLFLVFGGLMALAVGLSMVVAYRTRPVFGPTLAQGGLDRYRDAVVPMRTWLLVGSSIVMGVFAGATASGHWRQFLLWRNSQPFGTTDEFLHQDAGFYVFELPWLHFLVGFVMAATLLSLIAAATVHYLFGGIRHTRHDRMSPAAQAQISVLLAIFMLAFAADYWLGRYDLLVESGSRITGMNYVDQHAVLPAREILTAIAVICAVLFLVNVWRRTWLLATTSLGLMVLSAFLLGGVWPLLVQQLEVLPSEPDKEEPFIEANIAATLEAFDLDGVETTAFSSEPDLEATRLGALDDATASVPVVDPKLVRKTFEVEKQVRSFYTVPPVLDVDRYSVDGRDRALVLGVRELDQEGIPDGDRNWSNLTTVYTHGNGVIAAYANQRPADDVAQAEDVQWAEGQEPDERLLSSSSPDGFESRVYFGEISPPYSIVGKQPGGNDVELDLPVGATDAEAERTTTYDGEGGVELDSFLRRLVYTVKFSDFNILLSERVSDASRILYDRNPGAMVKKVAPWLTVDSDPYPAVIEGRIVWLLDGYTATNAYPQAQLGSFDTMTTDALATDNAFQAIPTDEINYMRNAVKATVDAYDGTVTLYAWDEEDPILKVWREVFPGVVKDKDQIPAEVLAHMRYPEDLFKVQRYQFARYHVTTAKDFFEANSRWEVPRDPEDPQQYQAPYRLFVGDGAGGEDFSLTSVYVPSGKDNLAAFVSVNSEADNEDYGKLSVLQLPIDTNVNGPRLAANELQQDDQVRAELLPYEDRSYPGNLLTFPVEDGLMYVQPIYVARDTSEASPPVLQFVLASFGNRVGIGSTLEGALADLLEVEPGSEPPADPETEPGDEPSPPSGTLDAEVQRLLTEAMDKYVEADELQRAGDTAGWAAALDEARALVDQALALMEE